MSVVQSGSFKINPAFSHLKRTERLFVSQGGENGSQKEEDPGEQTQDTRGNDHNAICCLSFFFSFNDVPPGKE